MVYPSAQVVAWSDMVRYHRAEQVYDFMNGQNKFRYNANIFYYI